MKDTAGESKDYEIASAGEKGGEITLFLSGRVDLSNLKSVMAEMSSALEGLSPGKLNIDLSKIDHMDSAGALVLIELERTTESNAIPFSFMGMPDAVRGLLGLISREAVEARPIHEKKEAGPMEQMGGATIRFIGDFLDTMVFLGDFVLVLASAIRHPRGIRWRFIFSYIKQAGADGLPIIGLISFLLGLVIALMALEHLIGVGGNALLPSIVTVAMVKEFGPFITAVLVTGRTGSAFAAEIASMKVNEEVDALTMMGFNPIRFLAVPRVLASIFVLPLLSMYADFLGILGGLVIGVTDAGLTIQTFIQEMPKGVHTADVLEGIVKSCIFGAIISGIGCQRGFKARGGAGEVGEMTTSAVVSAIFLILLTDATMALIMSRLGL
ncbi:MAG: ABC transporter permease [Nitrospiraceae bacterium]|nr:ABC transporter permease [Nitrospiraceae bacterium]